MRKSKKIILSLAIMIMVVISTTALDDSQRAFAKSGIQQLDNITYYYEIEYVTNLDIDDRILNDVTYNNQYFENYVVKFYDASGYNLQGNKMVKNQVKLARDGKISFNPKHINPRSLLDKTIEFKVLPTTKEYNNYIQAKTNGHKYVLRSISTNIFFSEEDENEAKFITNEQAMLASSNNASQRFTYLTSSIYVYDEYRNNGIQKRHNFSAYHSRPNAINSSPAFATTTKYDEKPDVLTLAWNVGGAISLNDPSIYMHVAYNNKLADGNTYYENLYKNDSRVSKHDSLFTGNSIGYNIPDYAFRGNLWPMCWASVWNINSNSGWYNTGSYNGANGIVRTELMHTYTNRIIRVNPGISAPPAAISFSISGETVSKVDRAWVYATVSPN